LRERMSTKRRRANSAYSTDEGGDIFEEMNHEDDAVKKIKLRGKVDDMYESTTHEGEKSRWLVAEVDEKINMVEHGLEEHKEDSSCAFRRSSNLSHQHSHSIVHCSYHCAPKSLPSLLH